MSMQIALVIRFADGTTERRIVDLGTCTLGREPDCDVRIESSDVSRHHVRLVLGTKDFQAVDLGSTLGTKVNGHLLTLPVPVPYPAMIQLGCVNINVRLAADELDAKPVFNENAAPAANPDARVPYQFGSEIARGGMGSILEAEDCKLGRKVAVKIMLSELNTDEDQKARFIHEAAVLSRLAHPNIVPVYDIGRDPDGQLYYSMKMVIGRTLQAILNEVRDGEGSVGGCQPAPAGKNEGKLSRTPWTLDRLLTIFRKAGDAMAFAHSHGIIHRDLKPENIMVGEFGEVLVMDWGLAKFLQAGDSANAPPLSMQLSAEQQAAFDAGGTNFGMTLEGDVMGTPQYMSPEQADGRIADMDARSDIFSLGGILYTILTLRPPVTGCGLNEILRNVATGNITPPTEFGTSASKNAPVVKGRVPDKDPSRPLPHMPGGRVPLALSSVTMKALSVEREKRYRDVAAFGADIEAYQTGFATSAERAGAWRQLMLLVKRNKAASIGVAAVLLVGGVLGTQAIIEGKRAEREAVRANAALNNLAKTAPTFAAQATDLVEQGDLEDALEKIGYAVSLEPRNADYLLQQANLQQATQRLAEAVESYHGVLALRAVPAATTNLELCEKLLRDNTGNAELSRESLGVLAAAMIKQGRAVEAAPLSRILGDGSDTALAAIRARLKPLSAVISSGGVKEVQRLPNGTFRLKFNGHQVVELPPLNGLPITEIDLRGTKVSDLTPLKGLRLSLVDIHSTPVTDLSPLAGMPIVWLSMAPGPSKDAKRFKISDLGPLKGMPLAYLCIEGTSVSDLSPLRGMALKALMARGTDVTDLHPTAGMPLEELDINYTAVNDLSPLAGMPLRSLLAASRYVTDISPLRGMPLRFLSLRGAPVTDLGPLAGMPLEELYLSSKAVTDISVLSTLPLKRLLVQCPAADLRPLAGCKTLERLVISKGVTDVSFLRTLPNLQRLSNDPNPPDTMENVSTAELFWKKYDARQAAEKK